MQGFRPTQWTITAFLVLGCTILMTGFLLGPSGALAQVPAPPPPPDTPTPVPKPTDTDTPPDTPKPSDTPKPIDTVAPTNTSSPAEATTPTSPPKPIESPLPTDPSTPTQAATSVQPSPRPTEAADSASGTEGNADCQAAVEGYVLGGSDQPLSGATVQIEGADWSNWIMTDEDGRYGFTGLCAGMATLRAFMSNAQVSQAAQVELNGRDALLLDLRATAAEATVPASGAAALQSPTPEPDMPTTGHSGWLLVGAALLGTLLLMSAGARRLLGVGARMQDRDTAPEETPKLEGPTYDREED